MKNKILLSIGIILGIVSFLLHSSTSNRFVFYLTLISFFIVWKAVCGLLCKYNFYYIFLCIPIACIYFFIIEYYSNKRRIAYYKGDFKVVAIVERGGIYKSGYSVHFHFYDGFNMISSSQNVSRAKYRSIQFPMKVLVERKIEGVRIINWIPNIKEIIKYSKPVYYRDNQEIGNDYYYYAKLQPDISLKNFGLRSVTKTIVNYDTTLFYTNITDSIDNQRYRCADSLQTYENRQKVGDTFGFLFHDGIYSKEQVFEEIPQAKEYYLKYCKEEQKIINEN